MTRIILTVELGLVVMASLTWGLSLLLPGWLAALLAVLLGVALLRGLVAVLLIRPSVRPSTLPPVRYVAACILADGTVETVRE